ncbi:serine hydrolase [Sphingomonas sanguinis]|uniref:serine hydrolase domain-containing protein n=1 Tax=Sphingomonas sanguinis TaxID=33051 RepID=UPI001C55F0F5|nr:serine hydrolase domain-containing protein [Sphingomonas sanguinis]QXT36099.1 serine hydrolase [Sphingomonas sanguinis]
MAWGALALALAGNASPAAAQVQANPTPSVTAPTGQALDAALDDYLRAATRNEQFSGTVLLARGGKPVFARSYGMANYELGVPNGLDTVFRLASVTKQFTALAVMQLQEQGKLKIDDPICRHLSNCPAAWIPITIRQLLNHTSGIPNFSSLPEWDEVLSRRDYKPAELVALFRDLPLKFTPGEKYDYSNSGYHLLGLIVESASGMGWAAYVKQRIFVPLGMTHSGDDDTRALIPRRASGYYSLGTTFINAPIISRTVGYSAGGLYSTIGDLLLWDRALVPGKLVSQASLDAMFTPSKGNYGFGWRIAERFGRHEMDHSGSDNGFSTYIIRFPADDLTAIVLSNSDRASAGKVGNAMAAIAFGQPVTLPVAQLREIMWDRIDRDGVAGAIARYGELKRSAAKLDFSDDALVGLGYDLYEAHRYAEAKAIFRFNLTVYPKSAYSHDGLADIAVAEGNPKQAIDLFRRSLALDPTNSYAADALKRLQAPRRP